MEPGLHPDPRFLACLLFCHFIPAAESRAFARRGPPWGPDTSVVCSRAKRRLQPAEHTQQPRGLSSPLWEGPFAPLTVLTTLPEKPCARTHVDAEVGSCSICGPSRPPVPFACIRLMEAAIKHDPEWL